MVSQESHQDSSNSNNEENSKYKMTNSYLNPEKTSFANSTTSTTGVELSINIVKSGTHPPPPPQVSGAKLQLQLQLPLKVQLQLQLQVQLQHQL